MHQRALLVVVVAVACKGTPAAGQGQMRSDDTLRLPPGFKISVFAENLRNVRFMTLGPGNAVYASQPEMGVIVKLTDANHDGVADSAATIASGLKGPFGIAFRGDTMYVGAESELIRFDPGARDPVKLMGLPGGGHSTRTIVFGPDGNLYVAVGSSCNLCDERDSMRAAVTQLNMNGSGGGGHGFAKGLRNTVGIAFNPKTNELWGGNNDRDNLGDDLPPE